MIEYDRDILSIFASSRYLPLLPGLLVHRRSAQTVWVFSELLISCWTLVPRTFLHKDDGWCMVMPWLVQTYLVGPQPDLWKTKICTTDTRNTRIAPQQFGAVLPFLCASATTFRHRFSLFRESRLARRFWCIFGLPKFSKLQRREARRS